MNAEKVVLVVDDSALDGELIKRSLQPEAVAVHLVRDAQGAMNYLGGEGSYAERELFSFPKPGHSGSSHGRDNRMGGPTPNGVSMDVWILDESARALV